MTANLTGISDYDNITFDPMGNVISNATGLPVNVKFQWQYLDPINGNGTWINIAGANKATFTPTSFYKGALGLRVQISYVDGKGYTEQLNSDATAGVTVGPGNTPPRIINQQQFNGISNTTAVLGQTFDYFSPFSLIFTDDQTAASALTYTATLLNGQPLSTANLAFRFDPATGVGEFKSVLPGDDGILWTDDDIGATLDTPGQIGVRVTATDPGGLSVTNSFVISVVAPNSPPETHGDTYATAENVGLATLLPGGVLHNDLDPNGDTFTASLVSGPAHSE